ncbi:MAG TPA: alpha-L-arabinofuranosidase C-terminal domain-containing protein [Bryocella sp.]|nr:alpha-L-arabinofuranosidase C-terminal domain-containing protein [Bryocella sp.]
MNRLPFARFVFVTTLAVFGLAQCYAQAGPATLTIDPAQIVHPVSPTLYGLMTEEINHSYDGGLYAEMVRNRTVRGSWAGPEAWTVVQRGNSAASMREDRETGPSKALPYSVRLSVDSASPTGAAGLANSGWWGMAVRPHTTYRGSFYAKVASDMGPLTAELIHDASGEVLAKTEVPLHAGDWSRYEYTLATGAAKESSGNHLELTVERPGKLWLQLVSLFPPTYNNTPNGNRTDLMERMAAMHPHFLRLPGGNYLEGDRIADRFDWKKTVGPMVDRPGHQAPWSYWSTDGLGLLEFLEWTEDLKIEPVLAVYAGYSLKGEHVAPGKDLEPYVQDAVDEVEYVTGDASTKWGAERARDGHPAAFPLHYIEIGNEDWFDKSGSYPARFAQIALALRKSYPQYKLIATAPIKVDDPNAQPDVIDDHYYKPPAEMFALVHHYDDAPRTGPKVFVGEWATRSGSPTPNFGDALGDAAWMTSMERNSDLIVMASYAPLFVNVNPGAMQWPTDLIGYDAGRTYGSPSYFAQVLFGNHIGDEWPKSSIEGESARFFYSATVDSKTKTLYLKLVNASDRPQELTLKISGLSAGAHAAEVNSLHGASFQATNAIEDPEFIHPVRSTLRVSGPAMQHTVAPMTIQVIDIPLR